MSHRRSGDSMAGGHEPAHAGGGRVTRSQAHAAAGALKDASTSVAGPASGGRGKGAAKKRSALHDLTNAAAARGAKAAASDTANDDVARAAMVTRRRAASMEKSAKTCVGSARSGSRSGERGVCDMEVAPSPPPTAPPTQPRDWTDVDAAHAADPLFCGAYVSDIYEHLRCAESKHRPCTRYMETVQSDINPTMRGILVDWLVEVAEEYKLVPDTLFLSVAYIDRCLSAQVVQRAQLQLVGVTCMLIAAKYEEIYAPQVDEFCYITDNTYTREQVIAMERRVLDTLNFELTTPTAKSFLRRFLRAAEADQKAEFLASFLAELSLLEYAFLRFEPSRVAASCVLVALWALGRPPWGATLRHFAGYTAEELRECATELAGAYAKARGAAALPAVREKYSQHKFKSVSCVVPPAEGFHDSVWAL